MKERSIGSIGELCKHKDKGGMGFRDIHAFNLAMLAKQAWRLIQGRPSLFVRVYKARYFPNSSFMDVDLGANPSFVWCSLLEARDLIRAGMAWIVGDGQSIRATDHRWLTHPPLFRPDANTNMKVADSIDHRTRQWNGPLLHTTFLQSTTEDIQRIKIGEEGVRDKLRWKENKNGCFSVRTAYRVALRLKQTENVEHSTAREDKKFWNKMWKLPVPPKVRNFMRRACSDILPTSANLCRMRVLVDPSCTICRQHDETVAHVLWECSLARNVWAMVKGKFQKCNSKAQNFYTLARQMEEKLPKK